MTEALSRSISTAHSAAKALYVARNARSQAIHEHATKSLPGGNTRTVLYTDPFPICMKSAKGYQVTSEDNKTYVSGLNMVIPHVLLDVVCTFVC